MTHLINDGKAVNMNPGKGFRIHLIVFLLTTPVIWLVWYLTDRTYPWPLWSTPAWAIGVLFHYLGVYVFKNQIITKNLYVMNQQQKTFRRLVTGHDADGKAIIVSDAPPVLTQLIGGPGAPTFFEVWHTLETPALIHPMPNETEENKLVLAPPKHGTRIRVIEFPPEGEAIRKLTGVDAAAKFKIMGDEHASTSSEEGAPHPLMHRTQTVDYGIVLEGEITMILDRAETTIKAGDIIIQNGTNHAWANRSGKICRMAFVLIDGQFTF